VQIYLFDRSRPVLNEGGFGNRLQVLGRDKDEVTAPTLPDDTPPPGGDATTIDADGR